MFKNFNAWTIHPLLRGADFSRYEMLTLRFDSSPHTRGRLGRQVFVPVSNRFIPSFERQTAAIKDTSGVRYDSSPPTRDRPFFCFIFLVIYRFIPSYEGQALSFLVHPHQIPIHPLLRGTDVRKRHLPGKEFDSSPHERGRRCILKILNNLFRFIPSCEGQTSI